MSRLVIFKDKVLKGANIIRRQYRAKRAAKRTWDVWLKAGQKSRMAKLEADVAQQAWEVANAKAKDLGV